MADEHKAVPVPPSALIPVGGTNFASMTDISQLQQLESSAPAFHRNILHALKASGKIRGDTAQISDEQLVGAVQERSKPRTIKCGKGSVVIDSVQRRKGTIVKLNAGYTKVTHTPVHRVCDKNGDVWLAKETNLKVLI